MDVGASPCPGLVRYGISSCSPASTALLTICAARQNRDLHDKGPRSKPDTSQGLVSGGLLLCLLIPEAVSAVCQEAGKEADKPRQRGWHYPGIKDDRQVVKRTVQMHCGYYSKDDRRHFDEHVFVHSAYSTANLALTRQLPTVLLYGVMHTPRCRYALSVCLC